MRTAKKILLLAIAALLIQTAPAMAGTISGGYQPPDPLFVVD